MNVLVVARLFSGLADSLAARRWEPTGVPAVKTLLEGLAQSAAAHSAGRLHVVFLSRDGDRRFARTQRFPLDPPGIEAEIVPWRARWPNALNELAQSLAVLRIVRRRRPDVAYVFNAGYIAASLIARLRLAPVVIRFLGIFPAHKRMVERGRGLARWFYRAPFAHAVSTLDGSGAEHYLPLLLRPGVPVSVLLNGVARPRLGAGEAAALRATLGLDARLTLVFVGRLEPYKGAEDFVAALEMLEASRPGAFQALVVGDGPLRAALAARLAAAGLASRVVLAGAVPHRDVQRHLAAADVYVSLNRYGGLSNANLEALAAGKCMLILDGDAADHTDAATAQIMPPAIVERLPRRDTPAALAARLAALVDAPAAVAARAAETAALAARVVDEWPARVEKEIAIIRAAARADAPAAAPARTPS